MEILLDCVIIVLILLLRSEQSRSTPTPIMQAQPAVAKQIAEVQSLPPVLAKVAEVVQLKSEKTKYVASKIVREKIPSDLQVDFSKMKVIALRKLGQKYELKGAARWTKAVGVAALSEYVRTIQAR